MGDLEDKILKKNIPGRFSTWTDDDDCPTFSIRNQEGEDDSTNSGGQSTLCNDYSDKKDLIISNNINNDDLSYYNNKSHMSGPKGVIADKKIFDDFEKRKIDKERLERDIILQRITQGSKLLPSEQSISLASLHIKRSEINDDYNHGDSAFEEEENDDDDIDNDDDFLESYRRQRLQQFKQVQNWPSYGSYEDVTPSQFSDAIDDTDPRVYCVIHLYENGIPSCNLLNSYFSQMCKSMSYCRFMKLKASLVKQNLDPVGFPIVLIYRDKKEVANLTPITRFFPTSSYSSRDKFAMEDVEFVLRQHGIVDPHTSDWSKK